MMMENIHDLDSRVLGCWVMVKFESSERADGSVRFNLPLDPTPAKADSQGNLLSTDARVAMVEGTETWDSRSQRVG